MKTKTRMKPLPMSKFTSVVKVFYGYLRWHLHYKLTGNMRMRDLARLWDQATETMGGPEAVVEHIGFTEFHVATFGPESLFVLQGILQDRKEEYQAKAHVYQQSKNQISLAHTMVKIEEIDLLLKKVDAATVPVQLKVEQKAVKVTQAAVTAALSLDAPARVIKPLPSSAPPVVI